MELKQLTPTVEELMKPPETNIPCVYDGCGKIFRHRPALNMHLTATHKLTGFGNFKKKDRLTYFCPVTDCPRSANGTGFPKLHTLKQHYRNIHADRNLTCTSCSKSFAYTKQLELHAESCGKVFVCCYCHTPYSSEQVLIKHQRSQHAAMYNHHKRFNSEHNGYATQQENTSSAHKTQRTTSTEKPSAKCAEEESLSVSQRPIPSIPQTVVILNMGAQNTARIQPQANNDTVSENFGDSSDHPPMNNAATTMNGMEVNCTSAVNLRTKYARILPKPTISCTTQTVDKTFTDHSISASTQESSSTQTDIMNEAVRFSGISSIYHSSSKCSVTTMTSDTEAGSFEGNLSRKRLYDEIGLHSPSLAYHSVAPGFSPNPLSLSSDCRATGGLSISANSSSSQSYAFCTPTYATVGNEWGDNISSNYSRYSRQSCNQTVQSDLDTVQQIDLDTVQQSDMDTVQQSELHIPVNNNHTIASQTTSNTDLGTQTAFSAILEGIATSASIELQCELGNKALVDNVMSFGTQTFSDIPESELEPSISQTEMSSFGTQTNLENVAEPSLKIPPTTMSETTFRPIPLHQSTSDFAMQFPYELMNFGTQTPLPNTDFSANEFTFDDDTENIHAGDSSSASLSQSSTQTDLEYLLHNIHTQTDGLF